MKRIAGAICAFCLLFQMFIPPVIALTEELGINEETPLSENEEDNSKTTDDSVSEKDTEGNIEETEKSEENIENEESNNEIKKDIQNSLSEAKTYDLEHFNGKGNLEIDIKFVLPIKNVENPNMGINIKTAKGEKFQIDFNGITTMEKTTYKLGNQTGDLSIRKLDKEGSIINGVDGENMMYYAVTLYNLNQDIYSIELYGDGYKNYKIDNIKLDNYSKRVSLSNQKGNFEVGDVNKDGVVNSKDADLLISKIDSNDLTYDLNRDGKVDIADLSILATTINGQTQKNSILDTSAIITDNISVEGNIDGQIERLFEDNGSVTVKPADETKPVSVENIATLSLNMKDTISMSQIRLETSSENIPEEMDIEVTDENNKTITIHKSYYASKDIHYFTDKANPNTIVIDLDGQIAVKKVTIKITKTSSKNLADIAKVEFLNNVYEEVPVPIIEVPKNIKIKTESEKAIITYDNMANVTGYEILIKEIKNGQPIKTTIYQTNYTSYVINDLDNYTEYQVSVLAINGEWRSNYSNPESFTPKPTRLPPAVDMVKLESVNSGFNISYKKMKDTLTYNIYYREYETGDYIKISNINGTSYQLRGLKALTKYQVYVTGNNELGEGAKSQIATATTKDQILPDTTNYKLINTSNGVGVKTNHIDKVEYQSNKYNADEFALVDNDYNSFWQSDSWDTGGFNDLNAGPTFTFDQAYKMNQISFVPKEDTATFFYAKINYWDEANNKKQVTANISRLTSPNGQIYYRLNFEAITSAKIQVNLANYQASGNNAMREFKFYEYDSLEDDVANLFSDDLRIELKENVTLEMIETLEKRANQKDEISGEYHPNRSSILKDLEYAKSILNDQALMDTITVDQTISNARNSHLGFAMSISDLQPLGVVARAGEQITVYVGTKGSVMPQLVFTQYYAEASVWKQSVVNLKKGQNVIDVPKIGSMDTERGGSIYVRYPSATASNNEIKVRVSGGTKIPVLDIHNLTDENQIKEKIKTYIENLNKYTGELSSIYSSEGLTFDPINSVLNSTEIVTKNGLLSVAATAASNGIKTGIYSIEEQVNRLYNSLSAFEEMMGLFYRQKGLSANPSDTKDSLPGSRINIRYMRMFDGAFMYAGGEHIGIGYGSISGLMQGRTNQGTGDNMTTSGFFGWGISHEIGHQINQSKLAYAEVTNNVYSLLAQTNDDKQKARIEPLYDQIYEKVTSNTIGKASNVFVSLGMYWQLHLAYDNNKTFNDTNSIYARINHLTRTKNLTGNRDDLLVMYASEAAGKDLTEFFEKWGLVPSDEAKKYASQFAKEERAIWYLNDEARRYRLNGGKAMTGNTVSAKISEADSQNKRYKLEFNVSDNDAILGYEIKRNGEVIGFTEDNTYTDLIGSMNNRAIVYEVTAYDKLLNKTITYKLPEVKVSHDGSINKANFSITSSFKNSSDNIDYEDPDMDLNKLSVNKLIDNDENTYFNGNEKISKYDKENPNVIIDLHSKLDVAGIKYRAALDDNKLVENAIKKYNIYVSKDRENWTLAKSGTFKLSRGNDYTETIYFDKEGTTGGNQLWTYNDISYVKIEAVGNSGISGSEIDVIAPPGDNIEISSDTIGVLDKDYHYINSEGKDEKIKAGSVVFKGDYRGNPAFNVVLLVDANNPNTVFEGDNYLFAKLNNDSEVYEIANGYWIYALTKEQYDKLEGKEIRAELYRVNDPITNEGQRLTSTSLKLSNLPAYDDLDIIQMVDSSKGE